MEETLRRLPDSELAVMQAIWHSEAPVDARKIRTALGEDCTLATTTVLTLLTRLAEKRYICIEKDGRRSVYTPLVAEKDYQTGQSRRLFDQLFGGSVSAFASALCEGGLSPAELAELRKLLEEERL